MWFIQFHLLYNYLNIKAHILLHVSAHIWALYILLHITACFQHTLDFFQFRLLYNYLNTSLHLSTDVLYSLTIISTWCFLEFMNLEYENLLYFERHNWIAFKYEITFYILYIWNKNTDYRKVITLLYATILQNIFYPGLASISTCILNLWSFTDLKSSLCPRTSV